ncbi:MAG: hypothetical protein AB1489_32055 [Acidobacteriota bacterium]
MSGDEELRSIFEEFKIPSEREWNKVDFESHYNLGLYYKDKELLDDAIEEFQQAIKAIHDSINDERYFNCSKMLGMCFVKYKMARPAIVWFERALKVMGRQGAEYEEIKRELVIAKQMLKDDGFDDFDTTLVK